MFEILREMTSLAPRKPGALAKYFIGAALCTLLGASTHAHAQALFTTESDFTATGWTPVSGVSNSVGPVSSSTYDFDGQSTDGLANYSAGAPDTAGSLQVNTGSNALGYGNLVYGEPFNDLYVQGFLNAWDPGATAGSTVAYSGNMYMVYTTPTWAGPDVYFQLGLQFNYPGSGYYGTYYFPTTTVSGGTIDGQATTIATIPYSVLAGGGGGFGINIVMNAGVYGTGVSGVSNVATSPIYIDDISTTFPVAAPVPEPATLGVLGTGLTMLMLRRRRQA
jgi:hypothetical protein